MSALYHTSSKLNHSKYALERLEQVAKNSGYAIELKPTRRVRGWPEPSARPYHLLSDSGVFLASFATLDLLENNLRARAAC